MIKLGDTVTDKVSGFTGIVGGISTYLYGCVRVLVESKGLHEGKPIDGQWFDEQRLTDAPKATAGGPQNDPPSHSHH